MGVLREAEIAKSLLEQRRLREEFFDRRILGEPTWDLLLDLYVAEHERIGISISSACLASCVPSSTALRNIDKLVDEGLLSRHKDPGDKRRCLLKLTPKSHKSIERYFSAILQRSAKNGQNGYETQRSEQPIFGEKND